MILNDRQHEIAATLWEVSQTPDDSSWGDKIDFLSHLATMIVGLENFINPQEMSQKFQFAWESYAGVWKENADQIIKNCLGQKEYDRVNNHPNIAAVRAVKGRILLRIQEVHGDITPNMKVNIEVKDIVLDELGLD